MPLSRNWIAIWIGLGMSNEMGDDDGGGGGSAGSGRAEMSFVYVWTWLNAINWIQVQQFPVSERITNE